MKKMQINNPEWYKVGYLYTSQYKNDVYVIDAIEVYHTGLSFPIYFLHLHPVKFTLGEKIRFIFTGKYPK